MQRTTIYRLAKELMQNNNSGRDLIAEGWRFDFNTRKRAIGLCSYSNKTIYLSTHLLPALSIDDIKDTLLHEIAHALVGPGYGHGRVWKRAAMLVGANPSSSMAVAKPENVRSKYVVCFINRLGKVERVASRNRNAGGWKTKFVPGRQDETLGKLKCVVTSEYERLVRLHNK